MLTMHLLLSYRKIQMTTEEQYVKRNNDASTVSVILYMRNTMQCSFSELEFI